MAMRHDGQSRVWRPAVTADQQALTSWALQYTRNQEMGRPTVGLEEFCRNFSGPAVRPLRRVWCSSFAQVSRVSRMYRMGRELSGVKGLNTSAWITPALRRCVNNCGDMT